MIIRLKRWILLLLLLLLTAAAALGTYWGVEQLYFRSYPLEYEDFVREYSAQNGIDPYFVWAIIRTESGFDPSATSAVGARGLMQLMEDTFEWVKTKLGDTETTFDKMYSPEENIRYGCALLGYLYTEFGDYSTAAAAYHAGRGATAGWLSNEAYSSDGRVLDNIPSKDTSHYVSKVKKNYHTYQKIYG